MKLLEHWNQMIRKLEARDSQPANTVTPSISKYLIFNFLFNFDNMSYLKYE
jgi:hypothetical protein